MAWSTSDRRSRLPKDWPARRRRVLTRDGHRCTWTENGVRCTAKATDVHHTAASDDHRIEALVSLCSNHHDVVTERQSQRARGVGADRKRPKPPHPGLL